MASTRFQPVEPVAAPAAVPKIVRTGPPPLRGNVWTFLRFAARHRMLTPGYLLLFLRWAWLKLRWRGRLQTDGMCFVCPRVKFEIGAKSVLGQECTISAFQHVSIGRECIIADRVMMIDFDHGVVEVERPIRLQGIYKRDVRIGHNVWIGYGAGVLRGVTVGHNSIIGTNSVVTADVPENTVMGGVPARVIRMREAPQSFRWG